MPKEAIQGRFRSRSLGSRQLVPKQKKMPPEMARTPSMTSRAQRRAMTAFSLLGMRGTASAPMTGKPKSVKSKGLDIGHPPPEDQGKAG